MWVWFSKLGSPKWFYELSGKWLPWLIAAMVIFMTIGLGLGSRVIPAPRLPTGVYLEDI